MIGQVGMIHPYLNKGKSIGLLLGRIVTLGRGDVPSARTLGVLQRFGKTCTLQRSVVMRLNLVSEDLVVHDLVKGALGFLDIRGKVERRGRNRRGDGSPTLRGWFRGDGVRGRWSLVVRARSGTFGCCGEVRGDCTDKWENVPSGVALSSLGV